MLNMLDTQDKLKNFSEQQLIQEMQMPTGSAPQFMVLGEIERRKRMRADMQRQEGLMQPTVAQEAVSAAGVPQQGIAQVAQSLAPQTDMTQNTGVPNVQAAGLPAQPNQPVKMNVGGRLSLMHTDPATISLASRMGMSVDDYISSLSPAAIEANLQRIARTKANEGKALKNVFDPSLPVYDQTSAGELDETAAQRQQNIRDRQTMALGVNPSFDADEATRARNEVMFDDVLGPQTPSALGTPPETGAAPTMPAQGLEVLRSTDVPALEVALGKTGNPRIIEDALLTGAGIDVATRQNPEPFDVRDSTTPDASGAGITGPFRNVPRFNPDSLQGAVDRDRELGDSRYDVAYNPAAAAASSEVTPFSPAPYNPGSTVIDYDPRNTAEASVQLQTEQNADQQLYTERLALQRQIERLASAATTPDDFARLKAMEARLVALGGSTTDRPMTDQLSVAEKNLEGLVVGERKAAALAPVDRAVTLAEGTVSQLEETLSGASDADKPVIQKRLDEAKADQAAAQAALAAVQADLDANPNVNIMNVNDRVTGDVRPAGVRTLLTDPGGEEIVMSQPVEVAADNKKDEDAAETPAPAKTDVAPAKTGVAAVNTGGIGSGGTGSGSAAPAKKSGIEAAKGKMDQDKWLALAQAGFELMSSGDFGKAGQAGLASLQQAKQNEMAERKLDAELMLREAQMAAANRRGTSTAKMAPASLVTAAAARLRAAAGAIDSATTPALRQAANDEYEAALADYNGIQRFVAAQYGYTGGSTSANDGPPDLSDSANKTK